MILRMSEWLLCVELSNNLFSVHQQLPLVMLSLLEVYTTTQNNLAALQPLIYSHRINNWRFRKTWLRNALRHH